MLFLLSVNFFQKILSEIPSECQTVWTQIRPNVLSGYIDVNLLFNVLPIVGWSSVIVFVLCIPLCSFKFYNHLEEEEKAGCFTLIVLQITVL